MLRLALIPAAPGLARRSARQFETFFEEIDFPELAIKLNHYHCISSLAFLPLMGVQ